MYVYVLNKYGKPLMPTQRFNRVRILLKRGQFYNGGKRYVMTGRHSYGAYLKAYGYSKENFSAKQSKIIPLSGLVYL